MLAWLVHYFFCLKDNSADVCNLGIMASLQSKKQSLRDAAHWKSKTRCTGDLTCAWRMIFASCYQKGASLREHYRME